MNRELRQSITLPNALSFSRLIIAPFLLALAWNGEQTRFLILLAVSLFTDAVDGYIARHWSHPSLVGSRLDSWGDFANYMSLPLCAWWLWPDTIRRELPFVLVAFASYVVPSLIAAVKFRRMAGYHTWGSKLSAVLISFSLLFLFTGISPWPFRLCTPIVFLAAIDDTAITFILSRWQPNVPSYRHALKIERGRRAVIGDQ